MQYAVQYVSDQTYEEARRTLIVHTRSEPKLLQGRYFTYLCCLARGGIFCKAYLPIVRPNVRPVSLYTMDTNAKLLVSAGRPSE